MPDRTVVTVTLRTLAVVFGVLAAAGPPAAAGEAKEAADPAVTDPAGLIRAMHDRYAGRWYRALTITQTVTLYEEGEPSGEEVWHEVLQLPGQVRSNIGEAEDGNAEIFRHGTYYWFRDGELVRERNTQHPVLHLGFDVYVQPPESTLAQLERAEFDLETMHEDAWRERPVYVVGAPQGDLESNQFWIDGERLVFVRQISRSPIGNVIDIQLDDFEELEGGWIATRLRFFRNGELALEERYQDYGVPEEIDPGVFAVDSLRTGP